MILSHPSMAQLEAYAAGSLSDGFSLLVAAHLTYCPDCRRAVAAAEDVAAALVFDLPAPDSPADLPPLDSVLARLDDPQALVPSQPAATRAGDPLPAPVLKVLGSGVDAIDWKFRMPGLHEVELPGFDGEEVSLLRARPGVAILGHTHKGEEATLIFAGAMQDGNRIYRKGDVALADQSDDHRPRIIGDETCFCLIVLSDSIRFTGPVGRVLNMFGG
jgi:putative transcriptional regulator